MATELICEVAEGRTPVYTYQILEVALSNLRLAYDTPEIYGSDCKLAPVHLIQSNIYEHLQSKMSERYYENKIE